MHRAAERADHPCSHACLKTERISDRDHQLADAQILGVGETHMLDAGVNLRVAEREDSGLRMIGSLGRDRAEASGELAMFGQAELT